MLKAKDYIMAVAFGVACGFVAFLLLSNPKTPVENALLQSAVVGLVGAGGAIYGRYNKEKENRKAMKNKKSKKSMKRDMKGK